MISLILQTFLIIRLKILFVNMRITLVSFQLKNMKGTYSSFSFQTVTKDNTAKLIQRT